MSDYVTDEMVETAARAAYNSRSGGYNLWAHATRCEEEQYLEDARAALEAAAPQIAAAAWNGGYAAAQLEWEHVYDGHTTDPDVDDRMCTECGKGNPYA